MTYRHAFIGVLLWPLAVACSGGYGPQPSGIGGWKTTAGQAGTYGGTGGTGGTGNAGFGGSVVDTAGSGGGGTGGAVAGAGGTAAAGRGGTGGAAGTGGMLSPVAPPSCDAIGAEPTIPTACATVLATKTVTAGSPSDETLDSPAIQAAITTCPSGQAVRLAADGDKTAFVSGPLTLKMGVTLWLDTGTTLFASHDPRDFDSSPGKCAGNNTGNSSCKALINVTDAVSSGVMGTGTIDGRGGELPTGSTNTWWELENMYDGNLAAPRLIQANFGTDFILYKVTLKNAPKFHVVIDSTVGYRVWGITINTPANSPNTDGVDPSRAKNGVIAYTTISTGDDNIAVKGGGPNTVDGLLVAHNHFGRGHGMSIGSETNGGVRNVSVCDLSLDGTDNGLRIKSDASRGGLVQGVYYTDVCIRGSRHPLVFDSYYSSATGTLIPDYRDISVNNVHVVGSGGGITFRGWDAAHPIGVALSNVVFDQAPTSITAQYANLTLGPEPVSVVVAGTGVTVTDQVTGTAAPHDCTNAWITFP